MTTRIGQASLAHLPMTQSADAPGSPPAFPAGSGPPARQPREQLWPYAELPEHPTPEEIASLDPDLHAALFGAPPRPFSITLAFPRFEGPDYERAVDLARRSAEYREAGRGDEFRHRARFYTDDVTALRDLFQIVGHLDACDVLIDDRPLPYARELWLPLVWILMLRASA